MSKKLINPIKVLKETSRENLKQILNNMEILELRIICCNMIEPVKFDGSEEQKKKYGIKSKKESFFGVEIGEVIENEFLDVINKNKDETIDYMLNLSEKLASINK